NVANAASVLNTSNTEDSKYDKSGLGNATPAQMAQYAVKQALETHDSVSGTPTVLLSRRVTRAEVGEIGLGCMGAAGTIEDPPLMLVVLKGDFLIMSPSLSVAPPKQSHYVAYIFDLWAGIPTYVVSSADGKGFRKVLKDPSLPDYPAVESITCPTPQPYAKTLHYGDTAPGFTSPPPLPSDIQASMTAAPKPVASPTMPIPAPIATVVLPLAP
ncbi:MAG: hypothetical protein M3Z04_06960, partial [Chloroflexota bacterium]|nr:hypothetical protein [Chloroflexota bacterium]